MLEQQQAVAQLRVFLDQIYNHDKKLHGSRVDLDKFNDKELLRLAGNLTDGVPMATPVFDGADEARSSRC
jgi:DNA-directed RNA polymerase subunit beta